MGRITLEQAAAWCGGRVASEYKQVTFCGANNDSRKLQEGQLFIALEGERDGHEFIGAAMEKGAAAVLCKRCDAGVPAIVVDDPRRALGDIACQELRRMGCKVVGITGSVGKSTTKEMISSVLETSYRVSKTPENHNNDIGMPMAVLSMPEDTEIAVLEMGMNHFHEMAYLSSIAQPDMAVIINIGTMHIEHLGSREGILQAKLEILEGLKPGGTVLLNGDDDLLSGQTKAPHAVYFGFRNENCKIWGTDVREAPGELGFKVHCGEQSFEVALHLDGSHFIPDAMAAVAVGLQLQVPARRIAQALGEFRNMAGRQEIIEHNGITIIKDCYNAGPESMAAALKVLGEKPGRRVAVLGDMLELGMTTQQEHYKVGRLAAEKADVLYAYGPNSMRTLKGALTGGMVRHASAFTDAAELTATLKRTAKPGDVILFKGSHGMHLELILQDFLKD